MSEFVSFDVHRPKLAKLVRKVQTSLGFDKEPELEEGAKLAPSEDRARLQLQAAITELTAMTTTTRTDAIVYFKKIVLTLQSLTNATAGDDDGGASAKAARDALNGARNVLIDTDNNSDAKKLVFEEVDEAKKEDATK